MVTVKQNMAAFGQPAGAVWMKSALARAAYIVSGIEATVGPPSEIIWDDGIISILKRVIEWKV